MAGSLAHIIRDDGTFTKDLVECDTGDCYEALAECHQVIAALLLRATVPLEGEDAERGAAMRDILSETCEQLGFPTPMADPENRIMQLGGQVKIPVIQPALHGYLSIYRKDEAHAQ